MQKNMSRLVLLDKRYRNRTTSIEVYWGCRPSGDSPPSRLKNRSNRSKLRLKPAHLGNIRLANSYGFEKGVDRRPGSEK